MPETPSSQTIVPLDRPRRRRAPSGPDLVDRRAALAKVIPRRAGVSWWLGIVLAVGFAAFATPAITAERWLLRFHAGTATETGTVSEKHPAPFTVRAPMFAGYHNLRVGGGVVVARGETADRDEATIADAIAGARPHGPVLYAAFFALIFVLATIFTHHMRRSNKGRLVRVQVVTLAVLAVLAVAVKLVLLSTALSALVVPVAVLALVPTMVLDRIVGLATGVLAALVVSLLAPFDVGLAILLLVQATTAGLVVAERPKQRWLAALTAGLVTTLCTSATYLLLMYLTTGHTPELRDPLHSPWLAAAIGPALAAIIAVPLIPLYQLLVGEITQGKLFALEDLGHPLLRQIAERAPGTWQHSLMMANMAEIAANAIGASGRLVRVGAYFHDLGKSLQPRYFIENLEAGEPSPHDQLPPEVSCDAIFAHVADGIVSARKARLHERIVDFMHMHHGNGVLEYFWAKCREQGNPHDYTIDDFRYPGHPPQSRETAILTICDAVEAASRTLKKPDAAAIDSLVQRIVYGKLHLGQLDESGLSMSDLRRISDSLRETIRHANHARIEYPWQKAGQDASASVMTYTSTSPRLDSLDRKPGRDTAGPLSIPPPADGDEAFAATADVRAPGKPRGPAASHTAAGAEPARNDGEANDPGRTVRGIERSEIPVREAATPPIREAPTPMVPITIPGRAPGPLPPAPDLITPQTFGSEPPAVTTFDDEPLSVDRKRAATLPPIAARRSPTPTPLASRRATGDPARTAGPPTPVDLDNAITNPPPMRRGPSGHPPVPSDPAQLATALATTVSLASAGPHHMPRPPEPAPPRPVRHVDFDNAITNPPPLGAQAVTGAPRDLHDATATPPADDAPGRTSEPRADLDDPTDLDDPRPKRASLGAPAAPSAPADDPGAIASQASPDSPAPAPRTTEAVVDGATAEPSLASVPSPAVSAQPAEIDTPLVSPPPAALPAGSTTRRPSSPPPRMTGLADGDRSPREMQTLRGPGGSRPPSRLAALQREDEARVTAARAATRLRGDLPARATDERRAAHDLDADVTEPSLPSSAPPERGAEWASGLAARIDAALDSDAWTLETPVVAPTGAELRALRGQADPTRQQPVDEIALLQRRAGELHDEGSLRRSPHPTTEVDPDDIEAAIELAPPARRPANAHAIGPAKPNKSE